MTDHAFAYAAEDQPVDAGAAVGGKNDDARLAPARRFNDLCDNLAAQDERFRFNPQVSGAIDEGFEPAVRVFFHAIEHLAHIAVAEPEALAAAMRQRVGVDDVDEVEGALETAGYGQGVRHGHFGVGGEVRGKEDMYVMQHRRSPNVEPCVRMGFSYT